MRKFVLAGVAMFMAVGLTIAAPAIVVKLDGDTLTVKEGKKGSEVEKTYTLTADTKYTAGDKDVDAAKAKAQLAKMAEKGKSRVDITGEDGKATAIKFFSGKKPATKKPAAPAPAK